MFNRQELLWLQDKFPEHMKKQGFELKRGERGSDSKHIETAKFKKQTLEKEIDFWGLPLVALKHKVGLGLVDV